LRRSCSRRARLCARGPPLAAPLAYVAGTPLAGDSGACPWASCSADHSPGSTPPFRTTAARRLRAVCHRRESFEPTRDYSEIDQDAYRRQLESACPGDPELLRAWVEGDWSVSRGAFFAGVLSEERCAVESWEPEALKGKGWDFYLAHDFGTSAPSVTYVCAQSPGVEGPDGRWYPKDSVVLVDELATVEPERINAGLGWTIPRLSEEIHALWSRWVPDRPPKGAGDDSMFAASGRSAGTIADEFKHHGVYFSPAHRGQRVAGWERMRLLLELVERSPVRARSDRMGGRGCGGAILHPARSRWCLPRSRGLAPRGNPSRLVRAEMCFDRRKGGAKVGQSKTEASRSN
jgi:hypothetical protein